jgi:histidyl-tRNA synthetase
MRASSGGSFIDRICAWLSAWGYREIEVPTLVPTGLFSDCVAGTENRMFNLDRGVSLVPEVTNFIRALGTRRMGTDKVFYVARCFRDESTTDAERLREFTQIGVELLGENALDCRKVVRKDAIRLLKGLLPSEAWSLEDNVQRGLNLYDDSGKTFEVTSTRTRKQLLGGGPYRGGAGWALGLERLLVAMRPGG